MNIYKITAKQITYCTTKVQATTAEEALEKARKMDGGDFVTSDQGEWSIIEAELEQYSETREELLLNLILRTTPRAWDEKKSMCRYDHKYNGGCVIGGEVSSELAEKLDKAAITNVFDHGIFDQLPKRLQNMGRIYLDRLQTLHDSYFGSSKFILEAKDLILEYNLNIPSELVIETFMNSGKEQQL